MPSSRNGGSNLPSGNCCYNTNYISIDSVSSQSYWSSYTNSGYATAGWGNSYGYPPQKPEFVRQMEEAIAEGERQEQKAKEKLWQDWLDSKMKESLY